MLETNRTNAKKIRPYALVAIPFIAFFAYQLATVLPHRPSVPDLVHGYTIAMGRGHGTVYVSAADLALLVAPFFCGFAIMVIGAWRIGSFNRLLRR